MIFSKEPLILISNDDGIDAPGIRLLAEEASNYGEVWVVAPAAQCSGMSQRITILTNIRVEERSIPGAAHAFSVAGTPADCVKIALQYLLPRKPDVVLSGINAGFNAGYDTVYSGTVGAAMEGLMEGVPAFAVSGDLKNVEALERAWLPQIMKEVFEYEPVRDAIVNVNFPSGGPDEVKGILREVAIAPLQMYRDTYTKVEEDETGMQLHQAGVLLTKDMAPEGTDIRGILDGYITIGHVYCAAMKR